MTDLVRIAFFSPLTPQQSGISDYSEDLLPFLAQGAELDLFIETGITPTNPKITNAFAIYPHPEFAARHRATPYDLCLYQMGNNPKYHRYMDEYIQTYPGIVTLHDFALQHFYVTMFLKEHRYEEYVAAMSKYYGEIGRRVAERFACSILHEYPFYQFPFYQRVADPSLGVIVHSSYVQMKMRQYNPAYQVELINMGIEPPNLAEYPLDALRGKYQLRPDQFVVGAYGYVSPGKRIPELLRAFARFAQDAPNALLLLVGHLVEPQELPGFDMRKLIHELGIETQVRITGFTPYDQFFDYIAVSDVCVNLRHPTVRATSANIYKIMAFAKPVLVSDLCELLDLPTTCCIKIPLNETEETCLTQALRELYHDPANRAQLGQAAREYVAKYHAVTDAAQQYLAFCARILARQASPENRANA